VCCATKKNDVHVSSLRRSDTKSGKSMQIDGQEWRYEWMNELKTLLEEKWLEKKKKSSLWYGYDNWIMRFLFFFFWLWRVDPFVVVGHFLSNFWGSIYFKFSIRLATAPMFSLVFLFCFFENNNYNNSSTSANTCFELLHCVCF
jgi:hypothetical protein